jgi:hypothetical protein
MKSRSDQTHTAEDASLTLASQGGADLAFPDGTVLPGDFGARLLRTLGWDPRKLRQLRFEVQASNPERRDLRGRTEFLVFVGTQTLCRLLVGKGLSTLWRRQKSFAMACPALACEPIFFEKSGGLEYLALEHFAGEPVETLVMDGRLTAAAAVQHAVQVVDLLAQTARPSTAEATRKELRFFFDDVLACPLFGSLDQHFLRFLVFPFVEQALLAGRHETRWSNGDLIPSNVLVDAAGKVRLVDMEHAAKTHFFEEDWWRWHHFSLLPAEARDLPCLRREGNAGAAMEAYFILRQLLLSHRQSVLHVAVTDAKHWIGRLQEIVAAAHSRFRSSLLYAPLAAPSQPAPVPLAPAPERVFAQLFWSVDGAFNEEKSELLEVTPGSVQMLRFIIRDPSPAMQLRFDPSSKAGLIRIEALRVRAGASREPLLAFTESSGWEGLRIGSGLYRLADSPALNLLSLNNDPSLLLPSFQLDASEGPLQCEVWLAFDPDLSRLPDYLRSGPMRGLLVGGATSNVLSEELEQARASSDEQLAEASRKIADLEQRLVQQLQEKDASLASLTAEREQQSEELRRLALEREQQGVELSRIPQLSADLAAAQLQLSQSDHALQEGAAQLVTERDRTAALMRELGATEARINDLNTELARQVELLAEGRRREAAASEAASAGEGERQRLYVELEGRTLSLRDAEGRGKQLEQRALRLEGELALLSSEFEQARQSGQALTAELEAARLRYSQVEAALAATTAERDLAHLSLREMSEALAAREATLGDAQGDLAGVRAHLSAQSEELASLRAQLVERAVSVDSLQRVVAGAQEQIQALSVRLEAGDREKRQLSGELESRAAAFRLLQLDRDRLAGMEESSSRNLAEARTLLSETVARSAALSADLECSKGLAERLGRELSEMKQHHAGVLEALHAHVIEIQNLHERNQAYLAHQERIMAEWTREDDRLLVPEDVIGLLKERLAASEKRAGELVRQLEEMNKRGLVRLDKFFRGDEDDSGGGRA